MIDFVDDITMLDIISSNTGCKFSVVVEVRAVETKIAKNSQEYLVVTVGDKTAACSCKIFGNSSLYNFFKSVNNGAIILLDGVCNDYKGIFSPDVTQARILTDLEIEKGNFRQRVTVCASEGVKALKEELKSIVDTISMESLRTTVWNVISEVGDDFYDKAAGIAMHHAYKNGLLEHTVHAARIGVQILKLYPFIDRDLAIAGLVLHDIGKVLEYTSDTAVQKTRIGILQGHLVLGYRLVRKVGIQNKLDGDILERLEHILLSHHNDPEFGSVIRPATPEAVFVALVDNLDAKMGMVEQLLNTTPDKNIFSDFHRGLENKLLVIPPSSGSDGE